MPTNYRVGDVITHKDTSEFIIGKVENNTIYINWDGKTQLYPYSFASADKYIKNGTWFHTQKKKATVLICSQTEE